MAKPMIYLNGYPGVGKLSVAKQLQTMIPNSKVLDNHKLIDPAAAVFERHMPEYQPLRKALRSIVLNSIVESDSQRDTTWIFTDQQSSNELGKSVSLEYQAAAERRGSQFFSIILRCDLEENLKRLLGEGRGGANTKLRDSTILREVRNSEDIFHFGGDHEIELDVTNLSAAEAAAMIASFVNGH